MNRRQQRFHSPPSKGGGCNERLVLSLTSIIVMKKFCSIFLLAALLLFSVTLTSASRFYTTGPVLTITLKDPSLQQQPSQSTLTSPLLSSSSASSTSPSRRRFLSRRSTQHHPSKDKESSDSVSTTTTTTTTTTTGGGKVLSNLSSLINPTLLWSIKSKPDQIPFPKRIPSLQSCSATIGYRHDELPAAPSFVEADGRFVISSSKQRQQQQQQQRLKQPQQKDDDDISSGSDGLAEIYINPAWEAKNKRASLVLRVGRNSRDGRNGGYGLVRFVSRGKRFLDYVRGSYRMSLPFNSLDSLTITPSFDFTKSCPTCVMTGATGSGRTSAILDLNLDNPTLTVVHTLVERNTISPEISLYNAKITYNWDVTLNSGSIRTRVDPTSAISVTWTDDCINGKWVTDFKLPLIAGPSSSLSSLGGSSAGGGGGGGLGSFAADIRVRRQFIF